MRKLVLVVHTSLDGFVAGPDGELDGFPSGDENLAFVCSLTEHADTAMFGRISYQLLDKFWPGAAERPNATVAETAYSNWYRNAKKIVLTTTLADTVESNTQIIAKNIPEEIHRIKSQPGKDILIFGSPSVAQLCIEQNLLDEYWIFINPVTFGKGIPLFTGQTIQPAFALSGTKQFANGELGIHYTTVKKYADKPEQ